MPSRFRPYDLYRAYPDHDLLPIEPPTEEESWQAFWDRLSRDDVGDGLFKFLALECGDYKHDEMRPIEAYNRAIRAAFDCFHVATAIASRNFPDDPGPTDQRLYPGAETPGSVQHVDQADGGDVLDRQIEDEEGESPAAQA